MKYEISDRHGEYIVSSKPGRPTAYHPKMCDVVVEVAQKGGFHSAMCIALGICFSTFNKYRKEYPEFAAAVEQADLVNLAAMEKSLVEAVHGDNTKLNFKAAEMLLSNKYRDLYSKVATTTDITINTINLTSDELNAKIAQKLQKLQSLGIALDTKVIEHDPVIINDN